MAVSSQGKSASLSPSTQVVICYRDTGQTLVTTAADYLKHCKTKYRNWQLSGDAAFISVPVVIGRFLPAEVQAR